MTKDKSAERAGWAEVIPFSDQVLPKNEINGCCRTGGGGVDGDRPAVTDIIEEIRARTPSHRTLLSWSDRPIRDVATYIQESFHRALGNHVLNAETLVDMVVGSHRLQAREDVALIRRSYADFQTELTGHLLLEGDILYPWIFSGNGWSALELIDDLRSQHNVLLRKMKTVLVPALRLSESPDACEGSRSLATTLTMLDMMLTSHVLFENNVLYRRVLEEARPQ